MYMDQFPANCSWPSELGSWLVLPASMKTDLMSCHKRLLSSQSWKVFQISTRLSGNAPALIYTQETLHAELGKENHIHVQYFDSDHPWHLWHFTVALPSSSSSSKPPQLFNTGSVRANPRVKPLPAPFRCKRAARLCWQRTTGDS
jgi:hypothetical protein